MGSVENPDVRPPRSHVMTVNLSTPEKRALVAAAVAEDKSQGAIIRLALVHYYKVLSDRKGKS